MTDRIEVTFEKANLLVIAGAEIEATETVNEHGHIVFRYYVDEPVLNQFEEWADKLARREVHDLRRALRKMTP